MSSAEERRAARFGDAAPPPAAPASQPAAQHQQQQQRQQHAPPIVAHHNNNNSNNFVGHHHNPYRRQGFNGSRKFGGQHIHNQQQQQNRGGYNNNNHNHHHQQHAPPVRALPTAVSSLSSSTRYNLQHDRNRKPMSEYDETTAVRIGFIDVNRAITESDIINEIEHMRLGPKIEAIFIEEDESSSEEDGGAGTADENNNNKTEKDSSSSKNTTSSTENKNKFIIKVTEGQPSTDPTSGKSIQWARVFMSNTDVADECATEFAFPGAQFKWKLIVQRLPIVDHFGELMKDGPAALPNQQFVQSIYHPVENCPIPQIMVVDSQEGYIPFMTTELFRTKGCQDYLDAKWNRNLLIRRLACKHYDPDSGNDCFFGVNCSFVHIHTKVMERLLRAQSYKNKLRFVIKRPEESSMTNWEVERRSDTLLVRDLPENIGQKELSYMFSGCEGFVAAFLRNTPYESRRYGIVRFGSRNDAFSAMSQTYGSGLSISFLGTLEDLRSVRIKDILIEEEEAKQRHIREKEERFAAARANHERIQNIRQQQQQGDASSSSAAVGVVDGKQATEGDQNNNTNNPIGYTSKKFGGDNNNNNSLQQLKKESGQRRPRSSAEFEVERRNSDSDNDDDGNNNNDHDGTKSKTQSKERSHDENRFNDGDENTNNKNNNDDDANKHDDSNAMSSRSSSFSSERSRRSSSSSSSSSAPSSSSSDGEVHSSDDDGDNANNNNNNLTNAEKQKKIGMKAKSTSDDFPALPDGWDWGFARKLNRYFFFEKKKKNKTLWKHPTTNKSYGSGGAEN